MKISLKESKEQLPLSFLADFISRGWDQIGMLKQELAAIKEEFAGTKKVEELIQGLVDAYLVCVGQLELHVQNKDYLEFPEEAKQENLKEELEVKEEAEGDEEPEAEENAEVEPEEVLDVIKDKLDLHGEDGTLTVAEKGQLDNPDAPKVETEITDDEFDILSQEFHEVEPEEENKEDEVKEDFEYFCDFDEPIGDALTDQDLYPEDTENK